jgi:hypothetical protein
VAPIGETPTHSPRQSSSIAVANELIEYRAVAQKESRIEETHLQPDDV